jgi:hypothetical protein
MADAAILPAFPLGKDFHLSIDERGGKKKLKLSIDLPNGLRASPIPPLHFAISMNGKPYHFGKELKKITTGQYKDDTFKYIKEISNLRNHLIYSKPEGIPSIEHEIDSHLLKRQKSVFSFLRVLCLIFPYREKAIFVQQAIDAFLIMLGDIETEIDRKST